MKPMIVECPCRNPKLHRKFQNELGGRSEGIFSLAQGRYFLAGLVECGRMTSAEYTEVEADLVAVGLPEFPSYTDAELEEHAFRMVTNLVPADQEKEIALNVRCGMISPADVDRLRETVRTILDDPGMKMLLSLLNSGMTILATGTTE